MTWILFVNSVAFSIRTVSDSKINFNEMKQLKYLATQCVLLLFCYPSHKQHKCRKIFPVLTLPDTTLFRAIVEILEKQTLIHLQSNIHFFIYRDLSFNGLKSLPTAVFDELKKLVFL